MAQSPSGSRSSQMSNERRECHLQSLSPHGFHRVVYYDWGDPANNRVVICVHGVGRNGRDFDALAEALSPTHRVIAVDMPGRGKSDWLPDTQHEFFLKDLHKMRPL